MTVKRPGRLKFLIKYFVYYFKQCINYVHYFFQGWLWTKYVFPQSPDGLLFSLVACYQAAAVLSAALILCYVDYICWASVTESGPALSKTSGICTTTKYWFTAGLFSPTRSCFATATTASSGLKNSHISFFKTKHLQILMFKHSFHLVLIPHICETQWRHSVKIKLYNTSSPILHSVKRSDVTRWKQGYIRSPPPYFIVLANSVKIKEVKVIEFHRITWIDWLIKQITHNYSRSYRLKSY